ncbi:MAG: hypothetical protein COA65_10170 [Rhodospirillaceae bacterium]|nr:MAG: hypothetical protein COA65_10170 [Rhodospirillaceae bacterium]
MLWPLEPFLLSIFVAALVGGVVGRWRGGWGGNAVPHTIKRLALAVVLATFALAWTGNFWVAGAALLIYPGFIITWGEWMDMARFRGTWSDDFWGMTGRGLLMTVFTGFALSLLSFGPWFMAAGILLGPIYAVSWFIQDNVGELHQNDFFDGPTAFAEILSTGWLFVALGLSLRYGGVAG